ncbi:hypothetical protein [Thioclava sp. DLFJ5-1]|uniref:hypothetical protein n=1 Tax=Thioclava sp. DLFJ5-1 TaxID=1915314 RepID=UPI00143B96E5|nr:hypothetical protein [Thioclava sp. DLFJ5-1]
MSRAKYMRVLVEAISLQRQEIRRIGKKIDKQKAEPCGSRAMNSWHGRMAPLSIRHRLLMFLEL